MINKIAVILQTEAYHYLNQANCSRLSNSNFDFAQNDDLKKQNIFNKILFKAYQFCYSNNNLHCGSGASAKTQQLH